MELGMIGLGRMGANMVERLMKAGHRCVAYDAHADAVQQSVAKGAKGTTSLTPTAAARWNTTSLRSMSGPTVFSSSTDPRTH